MEPPTLQSILLDHYPAYERTHPLTKTVREAVHAMTSCRTAALGRHTQACPEGHHTQVSCRHRACPQCAFIQTAHWLEAQKARLLDCDHYRAIFTIPHDLNSPRVKSRFLEGLDRSVWQGGKAPLYD